MLFDYVSSQLVTNNVVPFKITHNIVRDRVSDSQVLRSISHLFKTDLSKSLYSLHCPPMYSSSHDSALSRKLAL